MPIIEFTVPIAAPPERCFDLARSVDFHVASTEGTGERPVGGVRAGLLGPNDSVTWRARHLGFEQELTSLITEFERPRRFRDSQVAGAFRRFDHDHLFEPSPEPGVTLVTDRFDYEAPLGPLGLCAERLFLTRYMEGFLRRRVLRMKSALESDEWRQYLPGT